MSEFESESLEAPSKIDIDAFHSRLRRLERRDWWLWVSTVIVTLVLTAGVVSLSLVLLLKERDALFRLSLDQSIRGLVGAVLLFNIYIIYQQVLIKRLRGQLAEEIVVVAGLRVRAEEFHSLAMLDPVTGLYNRRFAERRLEAEVNRCRRYSYPLTVLILRIDGFKEINEQLGSSAGDKVLRMFAARLTNIVKVSDVAIRMAGAEFMALLPECCPEQVPGLLQRLEPLETDFHGRRIPVKVSAGWAGYESGELPEQLVERAQQELSGQAPTPFHRQIPQVP